jgi:hypothetical protein
MAVPTPDPNSIKFDITVRRQRLGEALSELNGLGIFVEGHTDSVGDRGLPVYLVRVESTAAQMESLEDDTPHWLVSWCAASTNTRLITQSHLSNVLETLLINHK